MSLDVPPLSAYFARTGSATREDGVRARQCALTGAEPVFGSGWYVVWRECSVPGQTFWVA